MRKGNDLMNEYDLLWDKFYNEALDKGMSKEAAELLAQLKTDDM